MGFSSLERFSPIRSRVKDGRFLFFIVCLLGFSPEVIANPVAAAVFSTRTGATGSCVPASNDVSGQLNKYNIQIRNGRQGEGRNTIPTEGTDATLAASVARVSKRLEALGARQRFFQNLQVWSAPDLNVEARQTAQGLIMKTSNSGNVAMVAHELGHQVGNTGGWYGKYNAAVRTPCHFTTYCTASHGFGARNEEFAEVFAAYVTHPDLLKNSSESCRQAYEFLKKEMFNGVEPTCDGTAFSAEEDRRGGGPQAPGACEDDRFTGIRETGQHLEAAAHAQEVSNHEQESGGSGFNSSQMLGVAAQFAPIAIQYFTSQQGGSNEATAPNILGGVNLSVPTPVDPDSVINSSPVPVGVDYLQNPLDGNPEAPPPPPPPPAPPSEGTVPAVEGSEAATEVKAAIED